MRQGVLEVIEEAVHLLRQAPAAVLALYYLGAIPFVLGLCFFWSDMSRSPDAARRCVPFAFGMALLFVWMKIWQAMFARTLWERRAMQPRRRAGWGFLRRASMIQAAVQPTRLLLLPVVVGLVKMGWGGLAFGMVFVILLPGGYAFYENVTVMGASGELEPREVVFRSFRHAWMFHRQNLAILAVLGLFGGVVFLDLAVVMFQGPILLKTLLGIETGFSRSPWSALNTTFLVSCLGLTFLCLDPLAKAVWVLRCFYGESRRTGDDLLVDLRQFTVRRAGPLSALLFLVAVSTAWGAAPLDREAAPPAQSATGSRVTTRQLDQAIEEVIQQREFTWRLPRERAPNTDAGGFMGALDRMLQDWAVTLNGWLEKVGGWFSRVREWIREKLFRRASGHAGGAGFGGVAVLYLLLWVLLSAALAILVIWITRAMRRKRARHELADEPLALRPDVADGSVIASELPEDEWLKLAGELQSRGELRLALRAVYLATLAYLAQREWIRIARHKSNREYERELARRAREVPGLLEAFVENRVSFERSWYGRHPVTTGSYDGFRANLDRIKAC